MAYFRTGTNDFSSIQYTNLEAGNIKNGVTVTVKDPNDITLKSVTGDYKQSYSTATYKYQGGSNHEIQYMDLEVTNIQNISSITFYIYSAGGGSGNDGIQIYKNGNLFTRIWQETGTSKGDYVTVTGLTNGSTAAVRKVLHGNGYGDSKGSWYIAITAVN